MPGLSPGSLLGGTAPSTARGRAGPVCVRDGLALQLTGGVGQTPPPPVVVLFVRGIFLPY